MASSGSGSREDEEHRMMASTTVFVLEPGVTALGDQQPRNGGFYVLVLVMVESKKLKMVALS